MQKRLIFDENVLLHRNNDKSSVKRKKMFVEMELFQTGGKNDSPGSCMETRETT